jgi:hypothetical protein
MLYYSACVLYKHQSVGLDLDVVILAAVFTVWPNNMQACSCIFTLRIHRQGIYGGFAREYLSKNLDLGLHSIRIQKYSNLILNNEGPEKATRGG